MNTDGVDIFTPSRLVLARERRGVTQAQLAEAAKISVRMVKHYEAGRYNPSAETLLSLATTLGFPVAFFSASPVDLMTVEAASFRAFTKAGALLRGRAVAAGTLGLELHKYLAERFDMPKPDVPDVRIPTTASERESGSAAARIAEHVRHAWGLGQRPIQHVVRLLELHGVRVLSLSEDCDAIDAFSFWRDGTPFVFLNTRKTAERSIFDAAHELGHLVMHQHGMPQGREAEQQADAFAAAFILPEASFRTAAPKVVTVGNLAVMKSVWRASVAALAHRLYELHLMSEWQYRHFNIELAQRGKKNEPSPLARETSAILHKTVATLQGEGSGLREISRDLCLPLSELRALTFGLHAISGAGLPPGPRPPQPSLRAVKQPP
jgi:Zn-dependent peptidase ImmA (M78 family)/transcriptional regulator with XRE-family HTH domain